MKAIDWSLIAKKAWETRRKNQGGNGGNGEVVRRTVKSEKERYDEETEKMMNRIFGHKTMDEEWASLSREMHRKMRRKTLMERALGIYERGNGICVGKKEEKFKVTRWSGGVKIGK